MAAFETTPTSGFAGRIGQTFAAFTAFVVDWNDKRLTRKALEQLSARELEDIGLSRGDVHSIR
ncbi:MULTISPECIES: DUF1127 domain-containing protein [unclassified Shimia]|uniref:DUF1127 domain-containing protein n=1 Tax=unclassified Shimia TaxID=2630038 RepID=UPI0031029903